MLSLIPVSYYNILSDTPECFLLLHMLKHILNVRESSSEEERIQTFEQHVYDYGLFGCWTSPVCSVKVCSYLFPLIQIYSWSCG